MRVLTLILILGQTASAWAKDFYVDPQSGSSAGDGSASKPWKTIQEVIDGKLVQTQGWDSLPYKAGATLVPKNSGAPIKAGDTIYLRTGYHGELTITGHYNAGVITIAAQSGHTPKLKNIQIRSGKNWHLRSLHVSPSFAPTYENKTMIDLDAHGYQGPLEQITVEDCVLQSVADASAWSAGDWDTKAANGISADGTKVTLRKNQLKNVNFGLSVTASHSLVEHNTVTNFSGDGMRGLGDHTVFQYNTVKNSYDVNANHDDGFQSWSVGSDGKVGTGQVVGVVLRGNTFINYEDPNQNHRGAMQGIGCFGGMYVDWVIENNVVIVDHWHGITLLGAKNCRVVNNTVLDPNTVKPGPTWIRIAEYNGTKPSGCVVRNNLVHSLNSDPTGVTEDHNIMIKTPTTLFVDPAGYDLHLLAGCPAIDKGSSQLAPKDDIDGTPRPQGSAVDVGAYEWFTPGTKFDAAQPTGDSGPAPGDGAPSGDGVPTGDGPASGDGAPLTDDGSTTGDAGGASRSADGCSCRASAASTPLNAGLPVLVLSMLLVWRRRTRR